MKTEYCRITVYHKEKNHSAIFDSNGMYETLNDFRVYLLGRGNEIISASTDAQFLDGNFGKAEYDENHILCQAHHAGEPIKTTLELDGVIYHALTLDDKTYVPDKTKTANAAIIDKPAEAVKSSISTGGFYKQYMQVKAEHSDAIVFYRAGDFYEILSDDAVTASTMLGLPLASRDFGSDGRVPMCGVPHHALDGYIAKLVEWGFKTAIAES